jgi:hypothetical protein
MKVTRLAFFALLLALLLLPAASQAQSGGGYDLSWSTVDGGGQTWSVNGNLKLGGTVGQHDAGEKHVGGNYALQGGFWRPVCRPKAVAVTITCNGDRVELDWTTNAANRAYAIYRATSPYQPPDPPNPHAVVTSPPWSDASGTCGDAATNYYYIVRSVCVGAHADDAERAEFDFALTPGD